MQAFALERTCVKRLVKVGVITHSLQSDNSIYIVHSSQQEIHPGNYAHQALESEFEGKQRTNDEVRRKL